jgi:hypothetical protein
MLKLFVSHSSRLDEVDGNGLSLEHNWRLLRETCAAIEEKYGDQVKILVDYAGLTPGEDWNHRLNLWLAECGAAIILFSQRALKQSRWVEKEATILSWRAELDPEFTLIPVTLKGQTTAEDLASDLRGVLKIDVQQCIRDVESAADIVDALVARWGSPDDLAVKHPTTPLQRLQGNIANFLSRQVTTAALRQSLRDIGRETSAVGDAVIHERFAGLLAQAFFDSSDDDAKACSNRFQLAWDPLVPPLRLADAQSLYKLVRSFWIEPGAAGCVLFALNRRQPIAMNGALMNWVDRDLQTEHFTIDRYIERAKPGWGLHSKLVSIDGECTLDQVRTALQRYKYGGGPMPPTMTAERFDQNINSDPKVYILVIHCGPDQGGPPSLRFVRNDLPEITAVYKNLFVILDLGATPPPALPDEVMRVLPPVQPERENDAWDGERSVRDYLFGKYPGDVRTNP